MITPSLVLSLLALVISLYCLWQSLLFNRLRKKFFSGAQGADLESLILKLGIELQNGAKHQQLLEQAIGGIKNDLGFATQKVGLVRFNPFDDGGGNFSFSLALLDSHNSGIIITSMYGRQQNRIYSKKIIGGKSETQLTGEEQQAISEANTKT